jgi:proline iminopeptidase
LGLVQQDNIPIERTERMVPSVDGTLLNTILYKASFKKPTSSPSNSSPTSQKVLLLLHGGPGVPDYLGDLASLLVQSGTATKVLCFDQRGVGQSGRNTKKISIPDMMDDIESIRQSYDLETLHLVGHSWGGMLARLYCRAHPERVQSLVLLSPTTASTSTEWNQMEGAVMRYNQRKASLWNFCRMGVYSLLLWAPLKQVSSWAVRGLFCQIMKNYYYDPRTAPDPPERFLTGISSRALFETKAAFLEHAVQHSPVSLSPSSSVPVLTVFGDDDIYGSDMVEAFRTNKGALGDRGQSMVLVNCSHLPWKSQPQKLLQILQDFYQAV